MTLEQIREERRKSELAIAETIQQEMRRLESLMPDVPVLGVSVSLAVRKSTQPGRRQHCSTILQSCKLNLGEI